MTGKSLVFLKNTAPIKLLSQRECVFLPIMHILKTPTRDQGAELIELNSFFPTDYSFTKSKEGGSKVGPAELLRWWSLH